MLVLPLSLGFLLQQVLVVTPVRVSILVLRPIPILESKIDIGTVPAVVPILLIPTSARVDVLSLAVVQIPVLAIELVYVRGLAWEKKLALVSAVVLAAVRVLGLVLLLVLALGLALIWATTLALVQGQSVLLLLCLGHKMHRGGMCVAR